MAIASLSPPAVFVGPWNRRGSRGGINPLVNTQFTYLDVE